MELTKEEFCLFNIKSKIQLIENNGYFLTRRLCSDIYLISLYKIYNFYVEVTYDIPALETLSVDPVINVEIINLYDFNTRWDDSLYERIGMRS